MRALSRREFGGLLAALPLTAVAARQSGLPIVGVATSSFRDLRRVTGRDNVEDVIRALRSVHVHVADVAFANVEPAPPSVVPVLGGTAAYPRRVVLTPEQIAATNAEARSALREWRLGPGDAACRAARARFAEAGITVHACSLAYDDSFSDDEIDATLRLAKQLGVSVVSSPLTLNTAKRLAPFAERHAVAISIRNQAAGTGAIDAVTLEDALSLCAAFRVTLDIGDVTASNGDALAVLRHYRARVSHVLVKDRLRNGGASQPLGEGDTPIHEVLAELKQSPPIPAMIDYDYIGLRAAADEVAASIRYVSKRLP